jgi:branched-subunit amino acid aminotransferase/4-amino-4-deoxychorismate lyase
VDVLDLARASEAFLTSTTLEVLPIRSVDGKPLGEGRPGPVGARLRQALRDLIRRELAL